jgi:hypothetical protein
MTQQTELNAPWTLHFDGDGTEDVAIICDSKGHDLARSRHFWRPEGDDMTPPTLAGMRVMAVAPKLLELAEFIERADFTIAANRKRVRHLARKVIAKATDDSVGRIA